MNRNSIILPIIIVLAVVAGYAFRGLLSVKFEPVATPSEIPVSVKPILPDAQPSLTSTNEQPTVKWQEPVKLANLQITKPEFNQEYPKNYYQVGTITSGKYAGGMVVLASIDSQSIEGVSFYHLIKQGNIITLVKPGGTNYQDYSYLEPSKYIVETGLTFSDLIFPKTLSYGNSTLNLEEGYNNEPPFDSTGLKLVFTDPKLGSVYTDATSSLQHYARNGFYVKASDGTLRTYSLDINFYDANRHVPSVTWGDGVTNQAEYSPAQIGGCGARNFASVETSLKETDLRVTGKTSQGDSVYETITIDPKLQNLYKSSIDYYKDPQLTFGQFVAKYSHPIFYWYDSFGRLIKFQRMDFQPAAECGKPVIYLYPEATTAVSVKLDPKGGFTKSEPAYNNGWNVVATPSGQLTEVSSGKTYPYLFWEGRGGLYETPEKGFVIAVGEVNNFLVEKLTKLGLNQKERSDFLEFWEPRMTGAPYFFVTFMGNQTMDQIAPLTISPKPDTVIRVLMDFLPLPAPISVESYDIRTPVRKGFTVVEWGGVLR